VRVANRLVRDLVALAAFPILALVSLVIPKRGRLLVWGPVPIINIKYWSEAMRGAGWPSVTLVQEYYALHTRADFDLLYDDLVPRWLGPSWLRRAVAPYVAFLFVLRNARVLHIPFSGGPLGETPLWRLEAQLLRRAGIPTVVIPYGADVFMYSRVGDPVVRNALQISYPGAARAEREVTARVEYWTRRADVVVVGFTLDGLGRWDVPVGNMVCLDLGTWTSKEGYSSADGLDQPVKILHTPNHRGAKGTEFLLGAVETLRAEGLRIDLLIAEGVPNREMRGLMYEADLLADQFVLPGYGLAAVEGMASGLPVVCNLESESSTRLFRTYSFLEECPLVSASQSSLATVLRALVRNPSLREELGRAGREYVEKFHSYETSRFLFTAIYERVLQGREVDLMNLFHPLTSAYLRSRLRVKHPLVENHLPAQLLTESPGHPARA